MKNKIMIGVMLLMALSLVTVGTLAYSNWLHIHKNVDVSIKNELGEYGRFTIEQLPASDRIFIQCPSDSGNLCYSRDWDMFNLRVRDNLEVNTINGVPFDEICEGKYK